MVRLPARRAATMAVRHATQLAKATRATQPTTHLVSTEPYIAQPTISAAATAVTAKERGEQGARLDLAVVEMGGAQPLVARVEIDGLRQSRSTGRALAVGQRLQALET